MQFSNYLQNTKALRLRKKPLSAAATKSETFYDYILRFDLRLNLPIRENFNLPLAAKDKAAVDPDTVAEEEV